MSTTREKLFTGGRRKRETIQVTVKSPDGSTETVEIDVLALSLEARGRIMTDAVTTSSEEDGDAQKVDLSKMMPEIIIACAMEVGTDTPIFSEGDLEAVAALDAGFLDPIFSKATALSGMSKSALQDAKGN